MTRSTATDAYALMVDVLQGLRQSRGLTQDQLARRLRKPQAFISNVERGARRIDVIEFFAIAVALEADPIDLFARVIQQLPREVQI